VRDERSGVRRQRSEVRGEGPVRGRRRMDAGDHRATVERLRSTVHGSSRSAELPQRSTVGLGGGGCKPPVGSTPTYHLPPNTVSAPCPLRAIRGSPHLSDPAFLTDHNTLHMCVLRVTRHGSRPSLSRFCHGRELQFLGTNREQRPTSGRSIPLRKETQSRKDARTQGRKDAERSSE